MVRIYPIIFPFSAFLWWESWLMCAHYLTLYESQYKNKVHPSLQSGLGRAITLALRWLLPGAASLLSSVGFCGGLARGAEAAHAHARTAPPLLGQLGSQQYMPSRGPGVNMLRRPPPAPAAGPTHAPARHTARGWPRRRARAAGQEVGMATVAGGTLPRLPWSSALSPGPTGP